MDARSKFKAEKIIEMAIQFKTANDKLCKELGYDYSAETFIKGDRNIVILNDIGGLGEVNGQLIEADKDENFWLCMIFGEIEPIKCELFDCD